MSSSKIASPSPRKSPVKFKIHEESPEPDTTPKARLTSAGVKRSAAMNPWYDSPPAMALLTSKMSNLTHQRHTANSDVENTSQKKPKVDDHVKDNGPAHVEKLLASLDKIDTSHSGLASPFRAAKPKVVMPIGSQRPKSTNKELDSTDSDTTPKSDPSSNMASPPSSGVALQPKDAEGVAGESEIELLRKQLAAANGKIAAMDQELTQQRITNDSLDSILRSPSERHFTLDKAGSTTSGVSPPMQGDEAMSNRTASAAKEYSRAPQGSSNDDRAQAFPQFNTDYAHQAGPLRNAWNTPHPWAGYDARGAHDMQAQAFGPQPQRPANFRFNAYEQGAPPHMSMGNPAIDQGFRRNMGPTQRSGSATSFYNCGYSSYPGSSLASTPAGISPPMTPMSMSMNGPNGMPYAQHQLGTMLSPTASEFSVHQSSSTHSLPMSWSGPSVLSDNNTGSYVSSSEPMNYRKLLDRNHTCDWKYIVDKIVCSNDQQASIFLQQKLKVASPEQKFEMIESIIGSSYPLMINRFGNFLIQRCLEHGTPDQVIGIANAIRGNVLNLSMDAFGCHVVQKALDVVPENIKASMVHELLHRIPETVIHRYACHVWQKLFELRWNGTPPQIMKRVNESLRGMWHEVALGETGSLVVQNIFENCLEEDKRPCINEVLSSLDMIAHGQFGNWCIQHICEHGLPPDKSRAIEHVLRFAADYSIDQFASKVVEKCLKVGGNEFLDRYLERVCEGRADRPRMPLIDIAGDQFGNYIVQYILINAGPHHRELVCSHVRKHMVSLRGSKFGSRVAMLCTNPAFSTRPGPPSGAPMVSNRFPNGPPMGPGMGRPMPPGPPYRYNN